MLLIDLARKRCTNRAALIAGPAALLLTPGRAEALLIYNIFDSGSNEVTLQASGSINRANAAAGSSLDCGASGKIDSNNANLCIGQALSTTFTITGPKFFLPKDVFIITSTSSGSPVPIILNGLSSVFGISGTYADGTSINSSAIFSSTSLATLGFNTPGLIASWQLVDSNGDPVNGDDGKIELRVGPPAEVPAPLPLFGAAAAFGWSRTLRRRLRAFTPSNA